MTNTLPENFNYLSPSNFKFSMKRAPAVNYFVQKINIPEMRLNAATSGNPMVQIKYPGDHIDFASLYIEFAVNDDMQDYFEIFDWMYALGSPEDLLQYAAIKEKDPVTGEGITSDLSLMILSAQRNPRIEFKFIDAFPVYLSDVYFTTTDTDRKVITATAEFAYTYFKYDRVI